MSSGGRARRGGAEGQERHPRASQVVDERPPFRAVRMERDVERVAMIEGEAVVQLRLTERAAL